MRADAWTPLAEWRGGTVAALAAWAGDVGRGALFAATPVGVFRSDDGGRSWRAAGAGAVAPFVEGLAVLSGEGREPTVYAGTRTGVYRSEDGGKTWKWVLFGGRVAAVAAASVESEGRPGRVVLAGTEVDGVLRSEDGGETWNPANDGLPDRNVLALAVSPAFAGDGVAFAATESALARTDDNGRSWQRCALPVEGAVVQCLAISPRFADDRTVLAGTEEHGLLRSTDGGQTWTVVPGLEEQGVMALAVTPDGDQVAAATGDGVALSTDGGATWQTIAFESGPALALAWAPGEAGPTLVAGVPQSGVYRLSGSTWEVANAGLHAHLVTGLQPSPAFVHDRTLFIGIEGTGVEVSTDGGASWSAANAGLDDRNVVALAVSPAFEQDRTLFAGTPTGLYRSRDGGAGWQPIRPGDSDLSVAAMAVAKGTGDGGEGAAAAGPTVALVTTDGAVLVSEDGGESWEARGLIEDLASSEIASLALSSDDDGRLVIYVGARRASEAGGFDLRLYRSLDGGRRWGTWLEARGIGALPVVVARGAAGDTLVFAGLGGRVAQPRVGTREVRRGAERPIWSGSYVVTEPGVVTALAVSPQFARDHTLFAATSAGVAITRDRGRTFVNWSEGLPSGPVVALAVSPSFATDRLVWAVGLGGTLWQRLA